MKVSQGKSCKKDPVNIMVTVPLLATVFYMYDDVFEHDKIQILKRPPNERCHLKNFQSNGVSLVEFKYIFCILYSE